MSSTVKEWIVVLVFLLSPILFSMGEAFWLSKKGWTSFIKALIFALLTNITGLVIGYTVLFIVLSTTLLLAWDGSIGKFKDSQIGAVLVLAVLFIPFLLLLFKRGLLALLKMSSGKSAWVYSVLTAILLLLISMGLPVLIGFILF